MNKFQTKAQAVLRAWRYLLLKCAMTVFSVLLPLVTSATEWSDLTRPMVVIAVGAAVATLLWGIYGDSPRSAAEDYDS